MKTFKDKFATSKLRLHLLVAKIIMESVIEMADNNKEGTTEAEDEKEVDKLSERVTNEIRSAASTQLKDFTKEEIVFAIANDVQMIVMDQHRDMLKFTSQVSPIVCKAACMATLEMIESKLKDCDKKEFGS